MSGRAREPACKGSGRRYSAIPFAGRINQNVRPEDCERLLRDAVRLLRRSGWCKGASARGAAGGVVRPEDDSAELFSALGALMRASHDAGLSSFHTCAATALLEEIVGGCALRDFNDDPARERDHVEQLFYRALFLIQQHKASAT